MSIEYLKRSKSDAEKAEDDAKVREVVSATLTDIENNGDAAVRRLAKQFDNYDRSSYRLSAEEIDAIVAKVSPRVSRRRSNFSIEAKPLCAAPTVNHGCAVRR